MNKIKIDEELHFETNKNYFLSELEKIVDISLIDISEEYWIIDSVNDLGIIFYGDEIIVGFHIEHIHFYEGNQVEDEDYDFIKETILFIKSLFLNGARFDHIYKGKKEACVKSYIKDMGSNEWQLVISSFTGFFRSLTPFLKKTVETEIIKFKQQ